MPIHLRIARPVSQLTLSAAAYRHGLGWDELGHFVDHAGFDGVMLGPRDAGFHLELTHCRRHPVQPCPTPEDLLVFYLPVVQEWSERCDAMRAAGFRQVEPFNPYWKRLGSTFEDRDGYRFVLQRERWPGA